MKLKVILLLFTMAAISCNRQPATNSTANKNEQLVKQYFEYFNKHNFAAMAAMYSDTADFKDPSLGQGIVPQTRQQTTDKYNGLVQQFPDLHDEVLQLYAAGDKHIVVEFLSSGTAPDGTKFQLPICTIFTIENGVITKDFTYYDNF